MEKRPKLLLGAHMSIAGGLEKALLRGESIGCTAIQIFTKNNRRWQTAPLSNTQITLFSKALKASTVDLVIAHTSYLINIGAVNNELYKKSIIALREELHRCKELNIPYLVLHPGSYTHGDKKTSLNKVAEALNTILSEIPSQTKILLETMAGQGTTLGSRFEQLASILQQSTCKHRLGICFDTCHVFATGYDFCTEEKYINLWKTFDNIIGLEHLKCIHLNDSKKELGSKVDRHEHIGKGQITLNAFSMIMNDPQFIEIPKIIETPKKNELEADRQNLKQLIKLLSPQNQKMLLKKK